MYTEHSAMKIRKGACLCGPAKASDKVALDQGVHAHVIEIPEIHPECIRVLFQVQLPAGSLLILGHLAEVTCTS